MNNSEKVLGVLLRELHCFSIDTLYDRLLLQKKLYLLINHQSIKLNYNYNWYIHGPYSPALTKDCYNIIPLGEELFKDYSLTSPVQEKVEAINCLEGQRPKELSIASWYELLASLLYLNLEYGFFGITDKEELKSTIKKLKPQYDNDEINNKAIDLIFKKKDE